MGQLSKAKNSANFFLVQNVGRGGNYALTTYHQLIYEKADRFVLISNCLIFPLTIT